MSISLIASGGVGGSLRQSVSSGRGGGHVPVTYLFIDGGYLRRRYQDAMVKVFGVEGAIVPNKLPQLHWPRPKKAFYYDCVDEQKKTESAAEFAVRRDGLERFFQQIQSIPGFHVSKGTLSGRRQKEVDVSLAVDMLTHAFYKNMEEAVLVAGDLDFRPVVEALVRLGTYVILKSVKKSVSPDLEWAADASQQFGLIELHNLSTDDFKAAHPLPETVTGPWSRGGLGTGLLRRGVCGESEAILHAYIPGGYVLAICKATGTVYIQFGNLEVLEGYVKEVHGDLKWNT